MSGRLAIVILNWNGREMMRRYLPSVVANSVGDVIVADNASTDGSVAMLREEFPEVQVIELDENYGFAGGYDKALAILAETLKPKTENSKLKAENAYDYFLLLNSDVEIRQKEWDRVLIEYMDEHRDCAACQPKLLSLREPQMFEYAGAAGGFLDKYGYPFCRGRVMGTVERDEGQYDTVADLLWATGAALMVRASDWRESGGLDERFFAHMEEIDLCWRLRTMGKRIVCVPQSTAYHLGGATLNQGNPRKTFLNFRNNLLMLYKNLPDDELRPVMRVRCLLDYVAAAQFMMKGDLANARAVLKARKAYKEMKAELADDRKRIQAMRMEGRVKERVPMSLLWQYYICRKKTFSSISLTRNNEIKDKSLRQ